MPCLCTDGVKYQILCTHRRSVSGRCHRLSLLIQLRAQMYLGLALPYTVINVILNAIPIYIGFRFIGKKFTLYSCLCIVLTSVLTDLIPGIAITSDVLLISIFGGIINGFAISLCLLTGSTTGGTDFILHLSV